VKVVILSDEFVSTARRTWAVPGGHRQSPDVDSDERHNLAEITLPLLPGGGYLYPGCKFPRLAEGFRE
jgi:hypothetical protein